MSNCFCKAVINTGDEREAMWRRVMGTNEIPIVQPLPISQTLFGADRDNPEEVGIEFRLDVKRISVTQYVAALREIAEWFDAPLEEVRREMNNLGYIPIKGGEGISTIGCQRHTLGAVL